MNVTVDEFKSIFQMMFCSECSDRDLWYKNTLGSFKNGACCCLPLTSHLIKSSAKRHCKLHPTALGHTSTYPGVGTHFSPENSPEKGPTGEAPRVKTHTKVWAALKQPAMSCSGRFFVHFCVYYLIVLVKQPEELF